MSTCRMFTGKVGEEGLLPQMLQVQPALPLGAHPQPSATESRQLHQLPPGPCAATPPWACLLSSAGCETHLPRLKAKWEVRDSTFPSPRSKSRQSKGLKVQRAVYFSFRNCHLLHLTAKPLPVVCTTAVLLYRRGGTIRQGKQMAALHTYAKLTQTLPFCRCYMFLFSCKDGKYFAFLLQCCTLSNKMTS